MDWGRTDPQLDVYVPSAVSPSGGMSLAPPSRHQPIASCDPSSPVDIVPVPEPIEHSVEERPSEEGSSPVDIVTVPEPI